MSGQSVLGFASFTARNIELILARGLCLGSMYLAASQPRWPRLACKRREHPDGLLSPLVLACGWLVLHQICRVTAPKPVRTRCHLRWQRHFVDVVRYGSEMRLFRLSRWTPRGHWGPYKKSAEGSEGSTIRSWGVWRKATSQGTQATLEAGRAKNRPLVEPLRSQR